MGPAVGADRIGRVEAVDDGVLVNGVLCGLPDLGGEAPLVHFPAVHVHHQVIGRFPLPRDGCPVDTLDVADHVDVGFNQLGVAAAQGGQAAGRLGHDLNGQGVEGDAAVFGEAILGGPEEVIELLKGVLLLQDEVGDAHGTNADGVSFVALEPGGSGAGAHGGFRHDHGAGALGVFGPVEREVQAHGVESYLNLVIPRSLGDAVDQLGQGHVTGFVIAGGQQFLGLCAQAGVQVEEHVVASDDVAVVGLDKPIVDGEGPDFSILADGPIFGHRRNQLAAATAADHGDLENALELQVFALSQQGVKLAVADVGHQQVDVAAGLLDHGGGFGGRGHGSGSRRRAAVGGAGRSSRGSRRGGGSRSAPATGHQSNQADRQSQDHQQIDVEKPLQSHEPDLLTIEPQADSVPIEQLSNRQTRGN